MADNMKTQPTDEVLTAFNINAKPTILAGGQGTSYLCGKIVIKPEEDIEEASWVAQTFSELAIGEIRIPQPIKVNSGQWVYRGWSAHVFIEGETTKSRWAEKIQTCREFHKAVAHLKKTRFYWQ